MVEQAFQSTKEGRRGAAPRAAWGRVVAGAAALACLGLALTMAWQHPVSPLLCLVLLYVWCCLAVWRPRAWLWVVPACLPWMNFSPWTGWVVFEEFDILLLATLASGYARMAWSGWPRDGSHLSPPARGLWLAMAVSTLVSMGVGVQAAHGVALDWFAGYDHALNTWRVGKSALFALAFVPLLQRCWAVDARGAGLRLAWGMLSGLTVVLGAVVWERAVFPGLLDFSAHYRTVALFWEMHVGGAALDVYLALGAPFVVWGLVAVRGKVAWLTLAALAVVLVYAGLTTFSRGVYLAMSLPVTLLLARLWMRRWVVKQTGRWRLKASEVLLAILVLEVAAVLWGGTFMSERLARAEQDVSSRIDHWRKGVGLLHTPGQWWLGRGVGRMPQSYASEVPDGEFSGQVRWHGVTVGGAADGGYVSVAGPPSNQAVTGLYTLTQRVEPTVAGRYRVQMRVRVAAATRLEVYWCERHLLYDRDCQAALVRVQPLLEQGQPAWQTLRLALRGPGFERAPWYAPRLKMLSLAVSDAGAVADVDDLALLSPTGANLLRNGTFSDGLAHWLGAAQSYFEPWHMDNLVLELLVERGWVGLLCVLALYAYATRSWLRGPDFGETLAPYMAASLLAVALVGLVSSVMDVPRIAFVVYLMLWTAVVGGQQGGQSMVDCTAETGNDRHTGP